MAQIKKDREGSTCYQNLRKAILKLEMRPGSVIDEAGLVKQFNVSRTPVREAIIQLIADGLVIREGRSARVSPLDIDRISPLYDALMIASRMVHRLSAEFRTEADLIQIKAQMELFEKAVPTLRGVDLTEINFQFHQAISAGSHNPYFFDFYKRVLTETLRLARVCFSETVEGTQNIEQHLTETARQHRAIYKAIEDKNPDTADKLAADHCRLERSRITAIIANEAKSINSSIKLD